MKVKSSIIEESIEIVDKSGETVVDIPFRVNITQTYERFAKARLEFDNMTDITTACNVVRELFIAAFGEEVTNALLSYYKDDYFLMVKDLKPLFDSVIFPAYEQYREEQIAEHKRAKR